MTDMRATWIMMGASGRIGGMLMRHWQAQPPRGLSFVPQRSRSAQETDEIYCRACIPRKARLDALYQAGWTPCFDILLMLRTVFKSLRGSAHNLALNLPNMSDA